MQNIVFNRTKIIATVGPASNSKEVLKELDVFLDEITFLGASEIKQELGNLLLSIE